MTLLILLIAYGILIVGVAALAAVKSVALFSYGGSFSAFLATAVFWGGFALVLVATASALWTVDWSTPLFDAATFFEAPI